MTAVHLLNRAPTKALSGKTPFEAYHGRKPAVHYLRTFGCVAHVKTVRPHQKKLDDRSAPMVFIGYEPGAKAYRVYDPVAQRVHVTRDIIFDENRSWDWSVTMVDTTARASEFIVECGVMEEHEPAASPSVSPASAATSTPAVEPAPVPVVEHSPGAFVSPPPSGSDNLDADHDEDVPLRYRTMDDILGPAIPRGPAPRNLVQGVLMLQIGEEPDTFAEAHEEQAWRDAMAEENKSIEDNNTWRLVTLPPGHRPIGLKWVYKVKKGPEGEIVKHKARLIAKGYVQQPGRDFDEVFTLVARIESVCMLLALAAEEGWSVHHMDVKSAFLNGELQEEVYVTQSPGFVVRGQEGKVLRLDKALYDLRQAPRAWNTKLDTMLQQLGFKHNDCEHAMYARGKGSARLLVSVYVDDLIITGNDVDEIVKFKLQMQASFKMSDLGLLSFYLGIEVQQGSSGISLSQTTYAWRILDKAGMANCNDCTTPMEPRCKMSKQSATPPTPATEFQSLIESLQYLVHTRPDIAFAVRYMSHFMEKPTLSTWLR
jgi:hypothetical protein